MAPREEWLLIDGINPEPWTAPEIATGRSGGRIYGRAVKNPGLTAFQEAIKDDLGINYPDFVPFEGDIQLELFLWRELPAYSTDRGQVRKHTSDATNMQKAIEDALQGIVMANDRQVQKITSEIIEQGADVEPRILVRVEDYAFNRHHGAFERCSIIRYQRSMERVALPEVDRRDVDGLF